MKYSINYILKSKTGKKMDRSKKPKYLSDYVQSLQRKVLYTEPIFLLDVEFAETPIAKKVGSRDASKYEVISDTNLKYDRETFSGISRFSNTDIQSKKLVSGLLRRILLEQKVPPAVLKREHSIMSKIVDSCSTISKAYLDKFDVLAFDSDILSELEKTSAENLLVIDFDTVNEQLANVAAVIKYIYFGYTGKLSFISQSEVIDIMKKRDYKLKANCILTYADGSVPVYGLLFTKES